MFLDGRLVRESQTVLMYWAVQGYLPQVLSEDLKILNYKYKMKT